MGAESFMHEDSYEVVLKCLIPQNTHGTVNAASSRHKNLQMAK